MADLLPLSSDELLSTTRSIRKRFDFDRPVPLELIYECIDLATQAPNGSNSQDWHFVVVTDPEKRRQLGEIALGTVGQPPPSAEENYLGRVPVLVIPCIVSMRDGKPRFSTPAPLYGSILPAVWSFCLAARARGLGTRWTTHMLHRSEESAAVLGIPHEEITQVALIPVAFTIGTDFKRGPRAPLDQVVHVNSW
jgi:nitroreductase